MLLHSLPHLLDPALFAQAAGFSPDPWQLQVLNPTIRQGLLCCSRQSGKTTAVAHRAAYELATRQHATVLIVSATENHAAEIAQRIRAILNTLDIDHHKTTGTGRQHDYQIPHTQARFLALPCTESAARGLSATLIILDEAALVPDKVWHSLAGTQAATWRQATLWLLSTPRGRTGFFHDLYTSPDPSWTRLQVTAHQCPRISAEFLKQKQRELPRWIYAQDYLCQFGDTTRTVFKDDDIQAALQAPPSLPKMLGALPPPSYQLGVDLGQSVNHSAFVTIETQSIPTAEPDPVTYERRIDFRIRVRDIQRLPLQVPYTEVIQHIQKQVNHPDYWKQITIVLDATGGNVFLDHLRAARLGAPIIPAVITSGQQATETNGKHHIPKQDLIANLEALFRERRIWLDPSLARPSRSPASDASFNPGRQAGEPQPPTPVRQHGGAQDPLTQLIQELQAFERIPGPQGKDTFSGKATAQDDLVIALALAAWRAVKVRPDLNHNRGIWGTQRLL